MSRRRSKELYAQPEDGPSQEALSTMRARGGTWAAYQNEALDHSQLGTWRFLKVGDGCTFATPPPRYPDNPQMGVGWAWLLKGMVNLESGKVVPP